MRPAEDRDITQEVACEGGIRCSWGALGARGPGPSTCATQKNGLFLGRNIWATLSRLCRRRRGRHHGRRRYQFPARQSWRWHCRSREHASYAGYISPGVQRAAAADFEPRPCLGPIGYGEAVPRRCGSRSSTTRARIVRIPTLS